jgi:hypothetical protein
MTKAHRQDVKPGKVKTLLPDDAAVQSLFSKIAELAPQRTIKKVMAKSVKVTVRYSFVLSRATFRRTSSNRRCARSLSA